jgi:transcriptional regulator with XRE-family HTH domain
MLMRMFIGATLRQLRESRHLSQGELERRSGLLRCYISRVENGHTIPTVDTLMKYARAFDVPLYSLFNDGETLPKNAKPIAAASGADRSADTHDSFEMREIAKLLSKLGKRERDILITTASRMAVKSGPGRAVSAGRPPATNRAAD